MNTENRFNNSFTNLYTTLIKDPLGSKCRSFATFELEQMHFQETIDYALRFVDRSEQIACFAKARSRIFSAMGLSERGISQKNMIKELGQNALRVTSLDFSDLDLKDLPVFCFLFQNLQEIKLEGNLNCRSVGDIPYQWEKLKKISVEPWSKIIQAKIFTSKIHLGLKVCDKKTKLINDITRDPDQREMFEKIRPRIEQIIGVKQGETTESFLRNYFDKMRSMPYIDLSGINLERSTESNPPLFLLLFDSILEIDISYGGFAIPKDIKIYCRSLKFITEKEATICANSKKIIPNFYPASKILKELERDDQRAIFYNYWDEIYESLFKTKCKDLPITPNMILSFIALNIDFFRKSARPKITIDPLGLQPAFLKLYLNEATRRYFFPQN